MSAKETWPAVSAKIQSVEGVLTLNFRLGIAKGAEITQTKLDLKIERLEPDKADAFIREVAELVDKYGEEIPF